MLFIYTPDTWKHSLGGMLVLALRQAIVVGQLVLMSRTRCRPIFTFASDFPHAPQPNAPFRSFRPWFSFALLCSPFFLVRHGHFYRSGSQVFPFWMSFFCEPMCLVCLFLVSSVYIGRVALGATVCREWVGVRVRLGVLRRQPETWLEEVTCRPTPPINHRFLPHAVHKYQHFKDTGGMHTCRSVCN